MKKIYSLLLLLGTFILTNSETINVSAAADYSKDIKEENDLASYKYDWDVVGIGAGNTGFDSGNLRMENINNASSNYALYKSNKFNSFRLDMYANLSLPSPTDVGASYVYDYANLYLTFFIDYDDASTIENAAMSACPWINNKGWLSVCFERIAGTSNVQLLINEAFDGNGANRYYLRSGKANEGSLISPINWCDGNYHNYSLVVTSVAPKDPNRIRYDEVGTLIKVYIDNILITSYFQCDKYYSNTYMKEENIRFDSQKGYIGFWASSGYDSSATTANTGVFVDIKNLQITSYDGVTNIEEAKPYTRCERPSFSLTSIDNFAPNASYEANEDIEINLKELFNYDGENKLTYEAFLNDEKVGKFNNGYFIYNAKEEGTYTIKITATDGDLKATNMIRLRVVKSDEVIYPSEKPTSSGCNGSISSISLLSFALLSLTLALKKKRG